MLTALTGALGSRDDGVRAAVDWEEVLRIDGMVKILLEMFAVPYVPVESLAMQEREDHFVAAAILSVVVFGAYALGLVIVPGGVGRLRALRAVVRHLGPGGAVTS